MSGKKNQYPASEGWIRMELIMSSKKPLGEDAIKKLATHGNAQGYEFGLVEQYGAKIKVVMRNKSRAT